MLLLMQPRIQLAFWAASAHCQVISLGSLQEQDRRQQTQAEHRKFQLDHEQKNPTMSV